MSEQVRNKAKARGKPERLREIMPSNDHPPRPVGQSEEPDEPKCE